MQFKKNYYYILNYYVIRKTRSIQSSDQPKEVTGKVLQEAEFSNNIASNAQTPPKSSDHFATERG